MSLAVHESLAMFGVDRNGKTFVASWRESEGEEIGGKE
jgi:hypothetical protein